MCLFLPFDLNKCLLGPIYKLCCNILTLFLKISQDHVVMATLAKKSQRNYQTCFSAYARMHLCLLLQYENMTILLFRLQPEKGVEESQTRMQGEQGKETVVLDNSLFRAGWLTVLTIVCRPVVEVDHILMHCRIILQ